MDAASALADLLEISSQLDAAVIVDASGSLTASTLGNEAEGDRLARAGVELLAAAEERFAGSGRGLTQLEVALREGSIFLVREGARTIVARATAGASSHLVLYDLRACLRSIPPPRKRRSTAKRAVEETADA